MLLLSRVGRLLRVVKDWYRATSSLFKCSELSTEDWEGSYFARFSRTKSTHFFLLFWADHRRKMAVCEEKYLPFKFPSLLRPASLLHFMVKNSRDDCKLSSCRSPFYFIADTSSNPPITRTWTQMVVIFAQFFKQKIIDLSKFKFFHYFTTKIVKYYSVITTTVGVRRNVRFLSSVNVFLVVPHLFS